MPATIDFEPLTIDFEPEEPVGNPKMSIGEMMLSQAEGEQKIASGDVPTGEMDQPILTIPRVPRSTLSDPTMTQEVLRGIQNKTADIVEGLTTPKNLMIGAGAVVAPEIVGLAMLPTLLQGVYGGGKEAYQGIKELDPAKIASGITESGISGLGVLGVGRRPIGDVLAATKIGLPDLESADIAARQGLQPQGAQVRAIIPKPFEQQGIVQTLAQPELQRTAEEGAGRIGADILAKLQAESDAELQAPVPLPQSLATVRNIPEERTPDASSIETPAKIHGDVRPQPEQGVREVPVEEGGTGVQPQAERGLPKEEVQAPVETQVTDPLTESPEGLQGDEAFSAWSKRTREAGDAVIQGLEPGNYELVYPDGTTANLEVTRSKKTGKILALIVGEGGVEELRGADLGMGRVTLPDGTVTWERGPTIRPKAKAPVAPQVEPQAVGAPAQPMTPVRQIALDELVRQGWNPKWPFVQADLLNKNFRDAIRSDPALSAEEKTKILSFGPKDEPTPTPKVEPAAAPAPALTEGGATEAAGETAKPAETPKAPKRKGIERPWDIIDELLSTVGTIRRKSAAKPGTEGYYTPEFHALSQSGASRKLFGPAGASPDEALSAAIKSGFLGEDATVADLENLISRANAQRRAISQGQTPEIQADKFQSALAKQRAKKSSQVISVGDLGKEDKFKIQGEEFEVVSIDPDTGEVTVRDGKKFGHQTIPDGADIPVEKGSFVKAPQSEEFLPEEPTETPPVKTPKLGRGETQGDLISSTQREDFALVGERGTDQERLAAEKAKTAQLKKEAEELAKKQQMELPGASAGPGAAAAGEPGTYSAIQQLSDRMATAPAKTIREHISLGERMANKFTEAKGAAMKTLAKARAIPSAIKAMRSGLRNINDVTRLVGELDYALQRSAGLSDQAGKEIKKGIVNDSMRKGTAIWIDAGGDEAAIRNALDNLPAGTKPEVRRAMEAALKLPQDVKNKARDISDYFAVRAQEAMQEGIFNEALEDYFTHIWKNRENLPDSVKGALNSGRVNEYFQFARKRTIPTLLEGIAQGKEPLLDPAAVVPFYNHALDRAIASRRFIKQLQSLKTEDGRPVVAPSGEGKLIEGVDNDYLLVKTTVTPKQLEGYRAVDHPALKKWKWAATDPESGRQVFYEGSLLVHPDHFERIARMMDRSRLTPWKATRALLRASGEVKGFKLGVASFFHPIQVGTHALFHLTKPWVSGEPINWDSPQVRLAIEKGGLQLAGDFRLKEQFAEGILSHGLVNKVPGIGPLSRALSDWTFGDYIPKLKLQTFETILARDMKRYAKDIASGKVTQEQVIARAGDAANNAFGELNRLWLGKAGRDPTMQRMLRLVFLAPDFGEARARFVGKALTKYGGEERMALATAVMSLYLAARIGNILSHGDAEVEDPKHMFDVRVGNRWWGVRSIVGDLRHLWDRPRQFWEVRLNPLYARTVLAGLTGRDPRGHKFTGVTDFAADIGKQFVPIHLGALTRDDQQLWESFAQAIGAQTWKGSATAELHRVAQDWRKNKGITDSTEILAGFDSPYRKARLALEFNDPRKFGEAIQEIEGNLRNRKDPSPRKTIESNFKRYYAMPFSGSNRLETDFKSSLDARDRKLYQEAQVERKALYQKFKSWY